MNRERVQTAAPRTAPPPPADHLPASQLPMATPMPNGERVLVPVRSEPIKLYPPKIAKALLAVSRKIQPVEKAGINDFHKYAYPKWEDIRDELWPLMNDAGLIVIQNEISHEGLTTDMIAITYGFTILNEDGDVWPVTIERTAVCKIRDGKGVLDDKAASKCGTQAEKNAMVQLFKIRTEDVYEVDQEGKVNKNSQRRRPVPAPDGRVAPHYIQGVKGETAQTWTAKFIAFIQKAASVEELEQWDELNGKPLDLVQERDGTLYNTIIDAVEAREQALTGGKRVAPPPPPTTATASGFPGDKKVDPISSGADDGLEIPAALDRREKKSAITSIADAINAISDKDRDWLMSLEEAFKECGDFETLTEEQHSRMSPSKDHVSGTVWNKAMDILNKHIERVNG